MKFIKLVIVAAAVLAVLGLFLPAGYVVERTARIEASAATIHEYVGDLERWDDWAPWRKADPSMVITLGDTTTGLGASQTWSGKNGSGKLVFRDSSEEDGIKYDVVFDDVNAAYGEIRYQPDGSGTLVTWTMTGKINEPPVVGPYLAMAMDFMVGHLFEQGLKDLKRITEES